jgi:hypothetical protein
MATAEDILTVRKYTNASVDDYPDGDLNTAIDNNNGDLYLSAADVWDWKAAKYSELVDTSESGSSRRNSSLYDNAIAQANRYRQKSEDQTGKTTDDTRPRTRAIQRI